MYRKFLNTLTLLLMTVLPLFQAEAQTFPYQDTNLSIGERVEDLLSRLTLDEKLSLMQHHNPAIPSLGLPAYSWWNEALHGVGRNGLATVWPMPIALAASFDPELVELIFAKTAFEARLKALTDTLHLGEDYHGLTFFTPNINIFRDPRWGRGMETYGEDPFLTATMGLACVNGLQHNYDFDENTPDEHLSAAACLKHLAVHSGPEGIRHQFDARVSPRDLWSTYLPAFEYIIRHSDVQQVMCGYNRLNGTPCCTNRELLVDILRNKWHYDGLIVTDCWALNDCWERDSVTPRHETHENAVEAAAEAFGNEVDLECGSGLEALGQAVDSGYISEAKINQHVRRILRTRLRVTEMSPTGWISNYDVSPAETAAESIVLLKNGKRLPLLPLQAGARIYLAGPNAADTLMPLGNYNGTPAHTYSIREGISQLFTLADKAKEADVIVYAGGLNPQLEGEELPVEKPGFYKGDRTRIELPDEQQRELHRLQRTHKPVVLLLCSGSAIALDRKSLHSDAIMACWYGGEAMGLAVAEALAGKYDCFGRLPVTFYKSTKQLPPFDSYDMTGRTYRYMEEEPLYPFGYGLSYAHFKLDSIRHEGYHVRGIVKNSGGHDGASSAIVQVYATNPDDPQGPRQQLIGFQRVWLYAGEQADFDIVIDPFFLRSFDENTQEPGPAPAPEKLIIDCRL